ncbi:MAG: nucleotidyltransferase, partial [Clostridiales bacterium]|nr:nucleotidyltransferase [Clostridiales bacterium]
LTDHCTVTLGVCKASEAGYLTQVYETKGIQADPSGKILCEGPVQEWISPEDRVSMNMWAAQPAFLEYLKTGFREFLTTIADDPTKKEYLLPTIVDQLIRSGRASVKVLETHDHWFGVTYKEDLAAVQKAFAERVAAGDYPAKLWS